MAIFHPRCLWRIAVAKRCRFRHRTDQRFDLFAWDPARTQDRIRLHRQIDDRRFHSHAARTAIHNPGNVVAKIMLHMCSQRWRRMPAQIRARSRQRMPQRPDQPARQIVVRHAHSHRIQPARDHTRHIPAFFQHQRQRSWPESLCQIHRRFRDVLGNIAQRAHISNVQDQRIVRRASLRRIHSTARFFVEAISAQAVDRLRRKSHQPSCTQRIHRHPQIFFTINIQ